jgi:EmrB/QacA subfamily drug resistance transporter
MSTPRTVTPPRLRALLILLCTALGLVVAGNSALAIALPDIAADTGADQIDLTWIIDAYALTFAALLLPAGILADRVGRRTILVIGLAVFGIAGIASAYATDPTWLIGLRALAGVGAAGIFPVTLSALVDAYPEDRRGFAVAVWSGVSAAGAVLGTIIAGALLEVFWWGSVQLVFGVGALLLIPGVAVLVAQHRNPRLSLDPMGALLAVITLTALVYGIVQAPEVGWLSAATLITLAISAAGLIGFVLHELRTPQPSLDVRAFREPALVAGSLLVSLQFFASLGLFVLAPQYLQIVRGLSPLQAAAALLVIPVGVGAGTALAPPMLARAGARLPGAAGMVAMAAGFAILAASLTISDGDTPWWALGLGLVVFGFGFGLAITPGTVLILDGLPADRRSVASAINDLTREVGGVLGIAVLSSALIAAYRSTVAASVEGLPAEIGEQVDDGAGSALAVADRLGPQAGQLIAVVQDGFSDGLALALWIGAGVLLAGSILCAVLVPRRPAPSGPDGHAVKEHTSPALPVAPSPSTTPQG